MGKYEMHMIIGVFAVGCLATLYRPTYSILALFAPLWLFIRYVKSVEKNCLFRTRKWSEVVEFDVPVQDIMVNEEVVMNSKDPNGFTLQKIEEMKKLAKKGKVPKKIDVKWGMPMIPAFPVTLLISVFFGDILFVLLSLVV